MLDFSADFVEIVDFLEHVTLVRRGGEPLCIAHALRRELKTSEAAPSNGEYVHCDVLWHLPQVECHTCPQLGDTIVEREEGRWTVLEVSESRFHGAWLCTCRDLAVLHHLDNVISIEHAEYGKSEGKILVPTWRTWRTGVRARIQPNSVQVEEQGQAISSVKQFSIFVADDVTVDHTYRIRAADGTLYRVRSSTKAQRLDELQTIEVETDHPPLSTDHLLS